MAEKDKRYYWLKLKKDFFKRHDIQIIENMPNGKDYILFYLKLLCESVDHDGNLRFSEQIPYNETMLATITNTNVDVVRSAINVFSELRMMEIMDDGTYYMSEVDKMLGSETYWAQKKREQKEKKAVPIIDVGKIPIESNQFPTCPSKSIEKEKDIDKDKDININSASDNAPSKKTISDFFEKVWLLYPNKKGKGQVSDSKKKTLYNIGYEELARAIERYKTDLAKEDWRKPQNGSTFFNSGYVDYLDVNYVPLEAKPTGKKEVVPDWIKKKKSFDNFEQRGTDYADVENRLLKTAGNDEGVRARAEALKAELS